MRWRRFRASSRARLGFACAGAVRNDGVRHSRGALVMLLDDDDEFLEGKIEAQVAAMVGDGCVGGASAGGRQKEEGGNTTCAGLSFVHDFSATEAQIGWGPRGAPPPPPPSPPQQLQQRSGTGVDTRMHRGYLWGAMLAKFGSVASDDGSVIGGEGQPSTMADELRALGNFPRTLSARLLRIHNYVVTSSVCFTRELWARRGPFRLLHMHTNMPEDYELWLRFFAGDGDGGGGAKAGGAAARGVYLPEPLVYYDAGKYDQQAAVAGVGRGAGSAAGEGGSDEDDDDAAFE